MSLPLGSHTQYLKSESGDAVILEALTCNSLLNHLPFPLKCLLAEGKDRTVMFIITLAQHDL